MEDTELFLRLPKEDKERLKRLAQYAFRAGLIPSPTLKEITRFGWNLANDYLHTYEIKRRERGG